jgi:hypothetical protein
MQVKVMKMMTLATSMNLPNLSQTMMVDLVISTIIKLTQREERVTMTIMMDLATSVILTTRNPPQRQPQPSNNHQLKMRKTVMTILGTLKISQRLNQYNKSLWTLSLKNQW